MTSRPFLTSPGGERFQLTATKKKAAGWKEALWFSYLLKAKNDLTVDTSKPPNPVSKTRRALKAFRG